MKYNVGDLIIETAFRYVQDYRVNVVIWASEEQIELLDHRDGYKNVYDVKSIDRWIERNNAKHYPVSK